MTKLSLNHEATLKPTPFSGCNEAVTEGFHRFFEAVTLPHPTRTGERIRNPSFSLTSRRYSIWTKCKEHLDLQLLKSISTNEVFWECRLLEGFKLSSAGKEPPKWCVDIQALKSLKNRNLPAPINELIVKFELPCERDNLSHTDKILKITEAWDQNLRFVIHSTAFPTFSNIQTDALHEFCTTVETVRVLLSYLGLFRAAHGQDPLGLHEGRYPQLPDNKTREQSHSRCEMCWRPTMRSTSRDPATRSTFKSRQLSARFCEEHDPSNPTSHYRAEHRYKALYQTEQLLGSKSNFLKKLSLPLPSTGEEALKDVYNRVHLRLRPFTRPEVPSFREMVWDLYSNGLTQAEIARNLNTSRQSVSRSLRRTRELAATFLKRRASPIKRTDYGPWSDQSLLVDFISEFSEKGLSIPSMVKVLNTSSTTVLAILEWLNENP